MDTSYRKTLELDKILERAAALAVCPEARTLLLEQPAGETPDEVRYALSQTDAIASLLLKNGSPRFGGVSGVQRTATVVACYTRPEFRGRGLMAAMLSAWPLVAMRAGVDAIYVETRNATMRHVAEKTGYEHASDRFRMTIEVEVD